MFWIAVGGVVAALLGLGAWVDRKGTRSHIAQSSVRESRRKAQSDGRWRR